ncbi:hypothetical protein IFM5058_01912 [Aspergillus udagawae]|nr:hypothetical protein IFM5058_01912 [Aspergillus udagawae]
MRILAVKTEPLVARLRAELETGLAKVSYFMTDDLTAMQAFVLFLIDGDLETRFDGYGLFWFGRSHWLSTVTSFASTFVPNSPTWKRNTKRLWHDIGFLGIKTAMERASELIMQASWFDSHSLANANDSDIALNLDYQITESEAFTELTFNPKDVHEKIHPRRPTTSDETPPKLLTDESPAPVVDHTCSLSTNSSFPKTVAGISPWPNARVSMEQ